MPKRPSRFAGSLLLLIAGGALCLAASSDSAGRLSHWVVQQTWFVFTGTPIDSQQAGYAWIGVLQKTIHVLLFGALGLICAIDRTRTGTTKLLGGLVLCVTGEALQYWSRTRTPSLRDVGLNVVSFLAVLAIATRWKPKQKGAGTE